METIIIISSVFMMAAAFLSAAAGVYLFLTARTLQGGLKKLAAKSLSPLSDISTSVAKMNEINAALVKNLLMCSFYTKHLQETVTLFSDTVNKVSIQPNKNAFSDMEEVERYRISLVDEYMAQGMSPNEAEVRASQDVMATISGDVIKNIGVTI